jgi:hypothetical protein
MLSVKPNAMLLVKPNATCKAKCNMLMLCYQLSQMLSVKLKVKPNAIG